MQDFIFPKKSVKWKLVKKEIQTILNALLNEGDFKLSLSLFYGSLQFFILNLVLYI